MNQRFLAVAALFVAFLSQSARAQTARNFLPFEGSYRGTAEVVYPGNQAAGTAQAYLYASPNGKSAVLVIQADTTTKTGNSSVPLSGSLVFSGGKVQVSDISLELARGRLYPGKGAYTITAPKLIKFDTKSVDFDYTFEGSIKIKPDGKTRQKLLISTKLVAGASTYTIKLTLKGKAPRPPK